MIFLPSAVCDIGSASFKYDMRRLSEILAFPKAWYRRSIARRLFLGDQTINLPGELLHIVRTSIHLVRNVSHFLGCKYIEKKCCDTASRDVVAANPPCSCYWLNGSVVWTFLHFLTIVSKKHDKNKSKKLSETVCFPCSHTATIIN